MSKSEIELITPKDLLFTNSPLTADQLALFYQRTPADKLMERPAKGGGVWNYVKTGYVVETLNRIFGYMWSFEVTTSIDEAMRVAASGTCVVKGRLTVHVGDKTLVKEQFGRCEVKYRKGTKEFLDFGNDLKGAGSDALKKCASEFGLFRDVYHKDDFEELDIISDEEKQQIDESAVEGAKERMRNAKTIEELRDIFVALPPHLRSNTSVVASKNALKRKIVKGAKK